MSERIVELINNHFNGASGDGGYNAKYNITLPVGMTYREIILKTKELEVDQISRVSLSLNGDEIVRVTGEELAMIRTAQGVYSTDDRLVIPFTDTSQTTIESQNFSELVTLVGDNLVLRVETGARKAAQENKVAEITSRSKVTSMREEGRVKIPRLYSDGMRASRSGVNRFEGLATQNKSGNPTRVQRLFVMNEHCEKLELMRNRQSIYEKTLSDNNYDLKSNGEAPPAGVYCYSAVQEGFAATDALGMIGDFEFIVDLAQAGDFNVLYQAVEILVPRG